MMGLIKVFSEVLYLKRHFDRHSSVLAIPYFARHDLLPFLDKDLFASLIG